MGLPLHSNLSQLLSRTRTERSDVDLSSTDIRRHISDALRVFETVGHETNIRGVASVGTDLKVGQLVAQQGPIEGLGIVESVNVGPVGEDHEEMTVVRLPANSVLVRLNCKPSNF